MSQSQTDLPAPPNFTIAPVKRVRTWPAVLTLYLFAALIPESIATVNTSPVAYVVSPLTLIFMTAFYGSGNLVIRELRIRRGLGWTSVLLLGAVFGFANEGIIAVTWFRVTPTGYILQNGVDWAWIVSLTLFHMIFSVVVPIAFVEIVFPRIAAHPWLSRRALRLFAILFVLVTALGFYPEKYRVNQWTVLAAMLALTALALLLPRRRERWRTAKHVPRLWALRLWGFVGAFLYFFAIYGVPGILSKPYIASTAPVLKGNFAALSSLQPIYIAVLLALFALEVAVARRWTARADWRAPQTLALLTGGMVPSLLISLGFVAVFQPVLTVPFFLWLVWLARRVKLSSAQTVATSIP